MGAALAFRYRPTWTGWRGARAWAVAFFLGAALYLPSLTLLQTPWQRAASHGMAAVLPTAPPLLLAIVPVLVSALVQEPAKLLCTVGAWRLAPLVRALPTDPTLLGILVGAGYGAMEVLVLLSAAFAAASTHPELGPATIAIPVAATTFTLVFQAAATGLVARVWARIPATGVWSRAVSGNQVPPGERVRALLKAARRVEVVGAMKALALVVGLHALLYYMSTVTAVGTLPVWTGEAMRATFSLSIFALLLRQATPPPPATRDLLPQ